MVLPLVLLLPLPVHPSTITPKENSSCELQVKYFFLSNPVQSSQIYRIGKFSLIPALLLSVARWWSYSDSRYKCLAKKLYECKVLAMLGIDRSCLPFRENDSEPWSTCYSSAGFASTNFKLFTVTSKVDKHIKIFSNCNTHSCFTNWLRSFAFYLEVGTGKHATAKI